MTEKTAQQIARMKEQTIGVEVEMNHMLWKVVSQKNNHNGNRMDLHDL